MAARVADIDVILQEKEDDIPCCPHVNQIDHSDITMKVKIQQKDTVCICILIVKVNFYTTVLLITGPALLFVKYGGDEDSQKRFYACSAFRDRKECNFFQWEDEKMTDIKRKNREEVNKSMQPKFTHHEFRERTFCETCGLFLLKEERKWHKGQGHNLKASITEEMCQKPSKLFLPLENNKTYAQYLFAESAVKFTLKVLNDLDISHVLCVGAPRIHESIMESNKMKTLLLDLDHRYFCRYNMFNHHFFDGGKSEDVFKKFVKETGKSNVAMVIDPPFGGMVEALAASINSIITTWRQESNTRITECLPEFSMLDYKVDYDNHGLFRGDTKKYGSPVRIFTNVSPEHIILPEVEGYWFCKLCRRYSAKENVHCQMCDSCTSK
ncbi:hypothetical protein KUTeg_017642, partial [Tegillarca granosa]